MTNDSMTCSEPTITNSKKYKIVQDKQYLYNDLCNISLPTEKECQDYCSNTDGCTFYQYGKQPVEDWHGCAVNSPCCYLKDVTYDDKFLSSHMGHHVGYPHDESGLSPGIIVLIVLMVVGILLVLAIFGIYKYTKSSLPPQDEDEELSIISR